MRFYGRRQGHALRPRRRQLMETTLPRLRVFLPDSLDLLDPSALFEEPKTEFWMEIGFGSGEHLVALALANPDIGFIGCEPFVNGVAALVSAIEEHGLKNIRIFDDDVNLLFAFLPDAIFKRIYLPYADPWPKTRHHRRRMIETDAVCTFSRLLQDGGEFRFASDHMSYVQWALAYMTDNADFEWLARRPLDWQQRPDDSVETRYEAKAHGKGSRCVYLRFRRKGRTD